MRREAELAMLVEQLHESAVLWSGQYGGTGRAAGDDGNGGRMARRGGRVARLSQWGVAGVQECGREGGHGGRGAGRDGRAATGSGDEGPDRGRATTPTRARTGSAAADQGGA